MTPQGSDHVDEPVPEQQSAVREAGSSSSARPPGVLRVLAVALLGGLGVAAPSLGVLTIPFAVALIALGRAYGASRSFVAGCIVAMVVVVATQVHEARWLALGIACCLLTGWLGTEHWRASMPGAAPSDDAWPEPRLDDGLSRVIAAWLAAAALVMVLVGALSSGAELRSGARAVVREAYASYDRECRSDGVFASREQLCEDMRSQRDTLLGIADRHAPTMLGALAAIIVVGGGGTAQLVTLARRRVAAPGDRGVGRRRYRLRDLELHWSLAYLGIAGVGCVLAATSTSGAVAAWLGAAAGLTAGAALLLVLAQGAALVAWSWTRRPTPMIVRIILIVIACLVLPATVATLTLLGLVDMWLRPRRRAVQPT